jgi:hypothetical protein
MNGYPQRRPNNMPIIILAIAGIAIAAYFVMKKKKSSQDYRDSVPLETAAAAPAPDPCKGVPDWACAATKLLNPLAKTSVDLYSINKGVYQPPQQY